MGHNSTVQTIATFTGTLLRRERAVGQKCVQLVFREGEENWLCVSADLKHNTLVVGKKYRVEGVFKKYGERPYIHTPIIIPYKSRVRRFAPVAVGALVSVFALGAVVYSYAGKHGNASHVLGTATAPNPAAYVTQTAGSAVAPTVPQVQAEAAPAPATDSKKSTKSTPTNTTPQTTNNNSNTQPSSTDTNTDMPTQPTDNSGGTGDSGSTSGDTGTGGTGGDATNPGDGTGSGTGTPAPDGGPKTVDPLAGEEETPQPDGNG